MGVGVTFITLLLGHLSLSKNYFSRSERLFSRVHGHLQMIVLIARKN
jgi:hypothetical protein